MNPAETSKDINFETSFARLEEILEKINQSQVSLDEALTLFEEADRLINACSKKLSEAEKKVETLIKNRNTGDLILGSDSCPVTEDFTIK